jgi:hypothetical protein
MMTWYRVHGRGKGKLEMKKIHAVGLALCALFALGAFAASSASAATEWLLSGEPITAAQSVQSEGELLLCDDKGGPFGEEACVKCSGLDVGTIGPTNKDEVTDVLNLAGTSLDITDCVGEGPCLEAHLVEAENLPWKTELVLDSSGEILDLLINAGYIVVCLGALGVELSDLCSAEDLELDTENMAAENDVLLLFLITELGVGNSCTRGGANQGLVEGFVLIFSLVSGLAVAVS